MAWTSWFSASCTRLLLTLLALAVCLGARQANGAPLTASWIDNSNGTATTRLERRLGTDVTFIAVVDVPPGLANYVDASVSPSTTYCYRALAYDASGVSPYSDEVCATSATDPSVLTVTVSKAGTGTGTVASTPAGIVCGPSCSATYPAGTSVVLAATPDVGSTFTGWTSGGCSGNQSCTITGNTAVTVTATFSVISIAMNTLTVSTTGPGAVTSTPAGIQCGSDCSEAYPGGTLVALTATPNNNGATFTGWSGACSGSAHTCTVTLEASKAVKAAFKKRGGSKEDRPYRPVPPSPVQRADVPVDTVSAATSEAGASKAVKTRKGGSNEAAAPVNLRSDVPVDTASATTTKAAASKAANGGRPAPPSPVNLWTDSTVDALSATTAEAEEAEGEVVNADSDAQP